MEGERGVAAEVHNKADRIRKRASARAAALLYAHRVREIKWQNHHPYPPLSSIQRSSMYAAHKALYKEEKAHSQDPMALSSKF